MRLPQCSTGTLGQSHFFRRDSKEIRFDRDLKKEIRKKFG
ncbi:hypothetical protein BIFCAT_00059 [Bifidobacterium catenulatum DSM 16992 = JCM 1194 = LMG 11043]|uniref:Uncharacterized protein n=1 Tax=Bifidobacterium catenulatum DSM 16992 = JCM 1194 = LMG 11043 TaxID=566552 RepID=B6XSJ9_9BIFI|nr:hypothetical protein BIFCAT_00059 [Bifidobacterium catenulatum DSM 16992 = JCM 1194 = LMG 11043]